MKQKIIIIATVLIIVISFPFFAIQSEKTAEVRDRSMDMYDVYDYDDPEDFYYDHVDEFDDI